MNRKKIFHSIFTLFFLVSCCFTFFVPVAKADTCSGSVTCASNCASLRVPSGCSSTCEPTDPYCVECTGYDQVCDERQEFCGFAHVWGGSCAADCSSVGGSYASGSCSSSSTNPTPTPAPTCTVATSWTSWSTCSKACNDGSGPGISTRYNTCSGQTQSQTCNTQNCPTSCLDNPDNYWTNWSCDTTCGNGTETRRNTCTGEPQSRGCSKPACDPVCTWGSWGGCNAACESTGTEYRTDNCGNSQSRSCSNTDSCTNCSWGAWTNCSAACNGTQSRNQVCNGVVTSTQTQGCNINVSGCMENVTSTLTPPNCNNMQLSQYGNILSVYAEATPSERTYVLPNPSFEDGTMSWWPYPNNLSFASVFDYRTNGAFTEPDGNWFMAMKRDPANYTDPYVTSDWFEGDIGDLSGKTVQLTFKARGEFVNFPIYNIGLQTRPENDDWTNGTSVYASIGTLNTTPNWQTYTFSTTFPAAPAGHSTSQMRIALRTPNSDYTAYYDNIQLKQVAVADRMRFYYTPYQGSGGNYCTGGAWTEIPTPVYVGPPWGPTDAWSASMDVSTLTEGQSYYIAANVWDDAGNSCTGNPSGTCGTGFTAQCSGCRAVYTACQTTCDACSLGTEISCGVQCAVGANRGAPLKPSITDPTDGELVSPGFWGKYAVGWTGSDARTDSYEFIIYPQSYGSPDDAYVAGSMGDSGVTWGTKTGSTGTFSVTDIDPRSVQGSVVTFAVRAINNSCDPSSSEYSLWATVDFTLVGNVTGEYRDDTIGGSCSLAVTLINLPLDSGNVVGLYKGNSLVTSQFASGTNFSLQTLYHPSASWNFMNGGALSARLQVHNPDLTQAYICSQCSVQSGTCTPDFSYCFCTINDLVTDQLTGYGKNFYLRKYNLANDPWWQTWSGLAYGKNGIRSVGPVNDVVPGSCRDDDYCDPHVVQTLSGPNGASDPTKDNSAGITMVDGSASIVGGNEGGGFYSNRNNNERVTGGFVQSADHENYDYFAKTTDVDVPLSSENNSGSNTSINTLNQLSAQSTATGDSVYSVPGNLTITINAATSKWNITGNTKHVIFVPGNLTINVSNASTNADQQQLINVDSGSFLAFIVAGNITISADIGYSGDSGLNALQTPNIEGVFISDDVLTVSSYGGSSPTDRKFVGAGTFVGWTNVDLQRDFNNGAQRKELHKDTPTETFIYRPDFMVNTPVILQRSQLTWQEVN